MFEIIQDRFVKLQRKLLGYGRLSSKEIDEAMREIRTMLLEADVNYKVVGQFIRNLQASLEQEKIYQSLKPGELVNVILYKEMVKLLGEKPEKIQFSADPLIINLVGLQGTGKTTFAAKLANRYKNKRPLLVACDPKRPAASEQLKLLAERVQADFFPVTDSALKTALKSLDQANGKKHQLVIFDTAGRLHIDDELMQELKEIKEKTKPHYNLLVVDGMVGQDAVNQATEFHSRLGISGSIVSKMDGDAKGGAVVSIRKVSGAPIFFIGTGEKVEDLEEFYPDRIASRILGMGDIASLVEKVESVVKVEDQKKAAEKFIKGEFNLEDFLNQLKAVKKMGSLSKLLGMIPGAQGLNVDDLDFTRTEAIILSMTRQERARPEIIDGSRRKRIAIGSGTSVEEVNRLLKEFKQAKELTKSLGKGIPKLGTIKPPKGWRRR
ncbi:MAG: signal recognition particle protein [candidate division WOR-3 bacterium]|nr:signal recognition particle protein [candidate division WOR-3 bacterium]